MKKYLLAIVLFLLVGDIIHAQEFLKSKDLSTLKVDMLTDEDILKYKQQLQQSGVSETQAEQLAIQKGLPSSEILKLRARVSKIESTISANNSKRNDNLSLSRSYDSTNIQSFEFKKKNEKELSVFGSELFTNTNLTFEPNLRIPTPKNYVLGPDDEVVIDVFGYQEVNQRITVSPEGVINIPNVGLVAVTGLTIEQATKRIKERMIKSGYSSISSNQSFIQVGVGRIRSIKVTVIGEVKKPGSYTLSSLSSLFNALYLAGGPTDKGSFREIELIRNGSIVTKLDAYEFLLKGDQSKNVRLSDQDVIRIPVAKNQVILKGEVKKPAIFETLQNDNLAGLLEFSGGFSSLAYKASVHITQVTDKEKRVKDVIKDEYKSYHPQDGDEIEVGKILERFDNRVSIKGAVYMPGYYELSKDLTISKLIEKANGLKQDAYISRGVVVRTNQQTLAKDQIAFNPKEIFTKPELDTKLQKDDEVIIGEALDFKDSSTITVEGEVKKPGVYPHYNNQTVKDILFKAGGFNDASSIDRVEIGRRVDGKDSMSGKISELITVSIDKDLNIKGNDIVLKPWDVVMVRSKPNYKPQIMIRIEGEVQYPGTYVLASKEDKVSELIKRAGGLTKQAFLKGIKITRINSNLAKDSSNVQFKKIQQQTKDTSNSLVADYVRPTVTIGLNMEEILKEPGGLEDVILQEGDVLNVAKEKREIKVSGEVLFPTDVVFSKGQKLRYYIERAGGFTDNARRSKVYVLQPNGVAAKTRHFLFIRTFPKIEPGCEILVPKKSDKTNSRLTLSETVALTSAIASLAGIVIAIVNVTKK